MKTDRERISKIEERVRNVVKASYGCQQDSAMLADRR